MKKLFEEAVVEIIVLTAGDIIVTSPTQCNVSCENETTEQEL